MSIFRFRTAAWFTLVTLGYLYASGAVTLGWWPAETAASPEVAIWFFAWAAGGLGATLEALRGLYWSVGIKRAGGPVPLLDPASTWWYVLRPVAGSLLGVIGYVAVRLVLSPLNVPAPVNEQSMLPFIAVAFAAGFGLMRVVAWRDGTVDNLLADSERMLGKGLVMRR